MTTSDTVISVAIVNHHHHHHHTSTTTILFTIFMITSITAIIIINNTTSPSLDALPLSLGVRTSNGMLSTVSGTIALPALKPARNILHHINGRFLIASP